MRLCPGSTQADYSLNTSGLSILVTSRASIDHCIPQGHPVSLPPAMAHQGPWRHPSKYWVSERGQTWFPNWVGKFLPLVYRLFSNSHPNPIHSGVCLDQSVWGAPHSAGSGICLLSRRQPMTGAHVTDLWWWFVHCILYHTEIKHTGTPGWNAGVDLAIPMLGSSVSVIAEHGIHSLTISHS